MEELLSNSNTAGIQVSLQGICSVLNNTFLLHEQLHVLLNLMSMVRYIRYTGKYTFHNMKKLTLSCIPYNYVTVYGSEKKHSPLLALECGEKAPAYVGHISKER